MVVCDGFVGNIVLKLSEGLASVLFNQLKEALTSNLLSAVGALLIKTYRKNLKAKWIVLSTVARLTSGY